MQQALKIAQQIRDLYDFAPLGYLSLSGTGSSPEVNLAGATLLGVARKYLSAGPSPALWPKRSGYFLAYRHRLKQSLHVRNVS